MRPSQSRIERTAKLSSTSSSTRWRHSVQSTKCCQEICPRAPSLWMRHVTGDDYAGSTFKHDFASDGIPYRSCSLSTSELYENMEPALNAGEIELPDLPKLQEQLL